MLFQRKCIRILYEKKNNFFLGRHIIIGKKNPFQFNQVPSVWINSRPSSSDTNETPKEVPDLIITDQAVHVSYSIYDKGISHHPTFDV